jgi:hypothetical protein
MGFSLTFCFLPASVSVSNRSITSWSRRSQNFSKMCLMSLSVNRLLHFFLKLAYPVLRLMKNSGLTRWKQKSKFEIASFRSQRQAVCYGQPSSNTVNLESLSEFLVKVDALDNFSRRFFQILLEKLSGRFAIGLVASCLSNFLDQKNIDCHFRLIPTLIE